MASPSRKHCTYSNPPQQNRQHHHRLQKDSDCLWWNDRWYRSNGPEVQWELILRVWKRYDMSTFHRRIYRVRTYKSFNSLLLSMEMWVTFTILIWYQHYCANVCLVLYVPIKWDRTFRLWVVILDLCTLILRISTVSGTQCPCIITDAFILYRIYLLYYVMWLDTGWVGNDSRIRHDIIIHSFSFHIHHLFVFLRWNTFVFVSCKWKNAF